MAKMISQAGEMTVQFKGITRSGSDLVLVGQMGVWDSQIIVSPREALTMARLMLRPAVLWFLITLPFRALSSRSGRADAPAS